MISEKIIKVNDQTTYSAVTNFQAYAYGSFILLNPETGRLGTPENPWVHSCRETFASASKPTDTHFAFMHKGLNLEKVDEFFEIIRKRLPRKPLIFHKTNNNCVIVEMSPFWRKNKMNKSFLTLFLRCAACFYKDNFDQALRDYALSAKIIPAINYFLDGHTVPLFTDNDSGVVSRFNGFNTPTALSKLLRKPKVKKKSNK